MPLQKVIVIRKMKKIKRTKAKIFLFFQQLDWSPRISFKSKKRILTMKRYSVIPVPLVLPQRAPRTGGAPSLTEIQGLKIPFLLRREEVAPNGNPTQFFKGMMKK